MNEVLKTIKERSSIRAYTDEKLTREEINAVITAGTAVRETMPILKNAANVEVKDMFISVNRCEVGQNPEKTTIMEVMEDFGINVHAIITVQDIYEYLKQDGSYGDILTKMKEYMDTYCVF